MDLKRAMRPRMYGNEEMLGKRSWRLCGKGGGKATSARVDVKDCSTTVGPGCRGQMHRYFGPSYAFKPLYFTHASKSSYNLQVIMDTSVQTSAQASVSEAPEPPSTPKSHLTRDERIKINTLRSVG